MSDTRQGPDWWLASDGKWYPPQPRADLPVTTLSPVQKWLWLGGAAAVVVGALLPWASLSTVFGTINKSGTDGDGVITLILGLAIGVLLLLRWNRQRARALTIVSLVMSVLIGVVAVIDMADVKSRFSDTSLPLRTSIGIGLWLTLLGAIAAVGGTIMTLARSG